MADLPTDDMSGFTATRRNALAEAEVDAFLSEPLPARLGTHRSDGFIHITPVWFVWERPAFRFVLGDSRRHLRNLHRDNRATLLVDVDDRPSGSGSAKGVMAVGRVTIDSDEETADRWGRAIDNRYLSTTPTGEEPAFTERYHLITLEPLKMMTWDFGKAQPWSA
jgi:nitroimidazol reductase NimA-like FMN-containing flavoprotein (pyridoxamine 5'-phosphate oxidase superfamily)